MQREKSLNRQRNMTFSNTLEEIAIKLIAHFPVSTMRQKTVDYYLYCYRISYY